MHSRDIGAVTMLNKQPTGGRSIGGGLRIGEMERDAILSHGTALFLKETMGDRADSSDFYICNGCGWGKVYITMYHAKNYLLVHEGLVVMAFLHLWWFQWT
jgi:DNA-directed RNA polymerase subunit B